METGHTKMLFLLRRGYASFLLHISPTIYYHRGATTRNAKKWSFEPDLVYRALTPDQFLSDFLSQSVTEPL